VINSDDMQHLHVASSWQSRGQCGTCMQGSLVRAVRRLEELLRQVCMWLCSFCGLAATPSHPSMCTGQTVLASASCLQDITVTAVW
jgi:hypothetical protein